MKKVIILLSLLFILFSCGSDSEEKENTSSGVSVEDNVSNGNVEEVKNNEDIEKAKLEAEKKERLKKKLLKKLKKDKGESEVSFISFEEVAKHSKYGDCYTIIDGKVYDVSSFFGKHPGGDENLLKVCGIDATELFNTQHGLNEKAKIKKDDFYIGDFK